MQQIDEASIPAYLKGRPRYLGFPIPFTTLIADDGKPDFKTTDRAAWAHAVARGACGLCGSPLVYWQAFIGGGTCKDTRLFFDPAMHVECAEFAAKVCPFIVGSKGYAASTTANPDADPHISSIRPAEMFLFKTRGYSLIKLDGSIYIKAEPFRYIVRLNGREE